MANVYTEYDTAMFTSIEQDLPKLLVRAQGVYDFFPRNDTGIWWFFRKG